METEQKNASDPVKKQVTFVSNGAPSLRIPLHDLVEKFGDLLEDGALVFKNGVLVLEEGELADYLKKLIATRPHVSQLVKHVDIEAAEAVAKRVIAETVTRGRAVVGAVTSEAAKLINRTEAGIAKTYDDIMREANVAPADAARAAQQLQADGLMVTENASGQVVRNNELKTGDVKPPVQTVGLASTVTTEQLNKDALVSAQQQASDLNASNVAGTATAGQTLATMLAKKGQQ